MKRHIPFISAVCLTISILCILFSINAQAQKHEDTENERIYKEIVLRTNNPQKADSILEIINNVSEKTGIDKIFLTAIMEIESDFDENAETPNSGNYGLMQINDFPKGKPSVKRLDPYQNTLYAAKVLEEYQNIFKNKPQDQKLEMMAYGYFSRMKNPIKEKQTVIAYIDTVMKKYHELK